MRYEGFFTISSTPVLDTSAYATADLLAGLTVLTNVFQVGGAVLQSVTVKDKDKQSGAFEIVLIKSLALPNSTLTLNAAADIVDADIANVAGWTAIAASDYATAYAGNAVACKTGIGLVLSADSTRRDLSYLLISRDAKTYTASGVILEFGFMRD